MNKRAKSLELSLLTNHGDKQPRVSTKDVILYCVYEIHMGRRKKIPVKQQKVAIHTYAHWA